MSETYSKYSGDNGDPSVKVEWGEVNNLEMKKNISQKELTENTHEIAMMKAENVQESCKENADIKSSVIAKLKEKWIDIDEWIQNKSKGLENSVSWETLVEVFLVKYKDELLKCNSNGEIEKLFNEWNDKRETLLPGLLTLENLQSLSIWEQFRRWFSSWWSSENETKIRMESYFKSSCSDWTVKSDVESIFSQYSYWEIIWKVLDTENFQGRKNDWFKKLQCLAWCYSTSEKSFVVKPDWWRWNQTGNFLTFLKSSEEFKSHFNSEEHLKKIDAILATHAKIKVDTSLYDQYWKVTNQRQEYLADPISYWKNQSVLSRHFVGIEESKTPYPSVDNMSKTDLDFITSNRNWKLDWELADLFDARWKSEKEKRDIEKRLQKLMPKEDMKDFLVKFLKNEKVRQEFESMFNLPATTLDDPILVETVVNWGWSWKHTEVRDWIVSWMRASAENDLVWLSIDLQSYIRKQCGLCALWVKTKFLESILWDWAELEEVERNSSLDPSDMNYAVYFKDKNCPSTTYEYCPNTWEIFAEKAYDSREWVLSFWKWVKWKSLIHKMDVNFSDFMQKINVEEILPDERCNTREDLKDWISRKIDSRMNYTASSADLSVLKATNGSMRLKNGIINDALALFWFINSSKGELIEKWVVIDKTINGPYYLFMSQLVDSVEFESEEDLQIISEFLSQINIKIDNLDSIDLNKEDPLMRFILKGCKHLKSYWDKKVREDDISKEWKIKDLVLWTVLESLTSENWKFDFEKIKILSEWVKNSKYLELASSIESNYNSKAQKYDVASFIFQTKWILEELETDVTSGAENDKWLEESIA